MLKFYRVNNNEEGRDEFLEVVDTCWIKGSEVTGLPADFYESWLELKFNDQNRIYVADVSPAKSVSVDASVVDHFVYGYPDMKTLPTKFNFYINVSGERILHSDNVYIAETEKEVWDYLKAL
jgi:hypothetical protein